MHFRNSDFYKLYTGDISSKGLKWVEASGMSSYIDMARDGARDDRFVEEFLPRKNALKFVETSSTEALPQAES